MTARRVFVVGGGVAGVAAAWALAKRGLLVTLLENKAGSSEFSSGSVFGELSVFPDTCAEFVEELGLWRAWAGEWNVTSQGAILRTLGADRALLDVSALSGKRVAVVDLGRDDWNAELLAGVLCEQPWSVRNNTRFVAVQVSGLQASFERRIPAADFAALHDDPARVRWLAAQLLEQSGYDAWLLGPWLGIVEDAAALLKAELGVPAGEAGSRPGGAAGARWKHARDQLLSRMGSVPELGEVTRISMLKTGVGLKVQRHGGGVEELEADAVILATGGVAAGGIVMHGSLTAAQSLGLSLAYESPLTLELDGEIIAISGSPLPLALEFDLGALERVGVNPNRTPNLAFPALSVAGDLRAGSAHSLAAAVLSGLEAAAQILKSR